LNQKIQTNKKKKTLKVYRDRNRNVQGKIVVFPAARYDPIRDDDHEQKVIKRKQKGMEGRESPNAGRDDFILQDELRQLVEERTARERETRKRRLKLFITCVVIAVVSIPLVLFFLRKML
jgi:hypothetical protein